VGTGWDFFGFAMADFARRKRIPFSIWPAVHPHQWGDDKIDLRLYKQADRVFCQSAGEVEHLTALGLERTKTIRCGLPPLCLPAGDGARLRHQLGIGTRPAVLFLGRRSRDKGYGILLQAWKSVLTTFPDAVLILAGPWADGERIENPDDSIRDLGTPDEETKADALAACDLFALPSAYESFGIVYVEAWSYGKPVICGMAPASRELIENGVTGLWVEQTPEAVSQAIIRLLGDSALRSSLGAEGRNLQLEKFTWDATAAAHEAAWQAAGSFTSSKP
jgi:glycosyltransferase involved in cell wall biosynthesis